MKEGTVIRIQHSAGIFIGKIKTFDARGCVVLKDVCRTTAKRNEATKQVDIEFNKLQDDLTLLGNMAIEKISITDNWFKTYTEAISNIVLAKEHDLKNLGKGFN